MDKNVYELISKYNMIKKGDTVIVALSGGADSMALFHFLLVNTEKLGFKLIAAHVNHRLRCESDDEAKGVQACCDKYNIMLEQTVLCPNGNKSEQWARECRYAFFDKLILKYGAKVATAHTATDNGETMLFNLCRGTGTQGASGIPPIRDAFIRPFLGITRLQTEQYCKDNALEYYIDKTNLTTNYTRGLIRNDIMPRLEQAHSGAKDALARFATDMREVNDYLSIVAEDLLQKAKTNNGYDISILKSAHIAIQKKAIALMLLEHTSINAKLISSAQCLLDKKSGSVNLDGGARLLSAKGMFKIQLKSTVFLLKPTPLNEGEYTFFENKKVTIKIINCEETINSLKVQKKDLIFCADYGKIPNEACFRARKAQDSFAPMGRALTKTLKKLFNEQAISPTQRAQMPLLASGTKVLWLWGNGFCEGLQVTGDTKKILYIKAVEE